jgi:hypothetical protein
MTVGNIGIAYDAASASAVGGEGEGGGGFPSLASGSLPSLGVNPLQPSWKRSVTELAAANQSLIGKHPSQLPPQASGEAQLLLGSRTDFSTLGSTVTGTGGGAKSNAGSAPSGWRAALYLEGGIEAMLRDHRDRVLTDVLKREREETQKRLDEALDRHLEEDWETERTWWKKELVGNRNLVDETNTFGWNGSVAGASTSTPAGRGSRSLTENLFVADYGTASTIGSNRAVRIANGGLDPRVIQEHLTIVRQIETPFDPLPTIAKFEKVALSDQGNGGYRTAWQMLASMLPNMQNPISGALGSMVHLCRQYRTIISNRVETATLNGQDVSTSIRYDNGLAGTIASYVKLASGSNASVWEIVYYCKLLIRVCSIDSTHFRLRFSHLDPFPLFVIYSSLLLNQLTR